MSKHRFPFAREGIWPVAAMFALSSALFFAHPLAAVPTGLVTLFLIWFFRAPNRRIALDPAALLSPADGTVLSVEPVAHDPWLDGPGIRISIFMSVFNVHINRNPCAGRVERVEYRDGAFLPAFKSHASELNERNAVLLVCEPGQGRLRVNQITGMLARRIVCDVKAGDAVAQGARFGMIRLGSCAQLVMPATCQTCVRVGEKVRAGRTVIARWP